MNIRSYADKASFFGAVATIAVGCATLIGYVLNNHSLKTSFLAAVEMNPATAFLFVCAGVSLVLLKSNTKAPLVRTLALVCAVAVFLLSSVKIGGLLAGQDVFFDSYPFSVQLEQSQLFSGFPNRMAPTTAVAFACVGVVLLSFHRRRTLRMVPHLLSVPFLLGVLSFLGYLFGVSSITGIARYIPMAANTALVFVLFSGALFLENAQKRGASLILSDSVGGLAMRGLMVLALIIPFTLGIFLHLLQENEATFSHGESLAFVVVLGMSVLVLVFRFAARQIDSFDRERSKSKLYDLIEAFSLIKDPVIVTDNNGFILFANDAVSSATGFSREECLGRNPGKLWGGQMPQKFYEQMWHTIKTEKGEFVADVRNRTKDGVDYWQELRIYPVLGTSGTVQYFIGIQPNSDARKAAEALKLLETEQRYLNLFDQLKDVIFTLTTKGVVTSLNPAFEAITGWDRSEWMGKMFLPLLHPLDIPVALGEITNALLGKESRIKELRFKKKNGEYGIGEFLVSIQKEGDVLVGLLGMARDITNAKRESNERLTLATIVESATDAIVGKTLDGTITSWNKGATQLYGFEAVEAIGKSIDFFVPDNKKNEMPYVLEQIRNGKIVEQYETQRLRKDGRIVDVSLSHFPLRDEHDEITGSAAIGRDLTEMKTHLKTISKLESNLELEKAKEGFVSLAAHQLRTPLTAIQGYAEMLTLGDAGKLNKKQKSYLDEVFRANRRMIDLINALLDVSRIDFGIFAIEPVPTDIRAVAEVQIHELESQLQKKKLRLKGEMANAPASLLLDPKLTGIIFQNLLSNAIKYTPEGGSISCTIKQSAPNLSIEIADTGVGIPAKEQDKIFGRLYRAENAQLIDSEGTGLGLYIVKAIVVEAGGAIRFESQEGKGTTFFVTLPLAGMRARKGTKGLH